MDPLILVFTLEESSIYTLQRSSGSSGSCCSSAAVASQGNYHTFHDKPQVSSTFIQLKVISCSHHCLMQIVFQVTQGTKLYHMTCELECCHYCPYTNRSPLLNGFFYSSTTFPLIYSSTPLHLSTPYPKLSLPITLGYPDLHWFLLSIDFHDSFQLSHTFQQSFEPKRPRGRVRRAWTVGSD